MALLLWSAMYNRLPTVFSARPLGPLKVGDGNSGGEVLPRPVFRSFRMSSYKASEANTSPALSNTTPTGARIGANCESLLLCGSPVRPYHTRALVELRTLVMEPERSIPTSRLLP